MKPGLPDRPRMVPCDRLLGLSTLFRPLAKRSAHKEKLDVRYRPEGGGISLHFRGPDALGIPEQTMLLVLLEIAAERLAASESECLLSAEARGVGGALWRTLIEGAGGFGETIFFSTTWYELARRRDASPGGSVQQQSELQLKRLCETTVWEKWEATQHEPAGETQSRLISWLYGDDKRVHVALNIRLAAALWGGAYSPVSLRERLGLPTDVARAVHAFLSVAVRHGHSLNVRPETLAGRLWPGDASLVIPDTRRRRIRDVCGALDLLPQTSTWSVEEANGVYRITRLPRTGGTPGDAREKTGHSGAESTSERTRIKAAKPSTGADFGAVDVSGLFNTR